MRKPLLSVILLASLAPLGVSCAGHAGVSPGTTPQVLAVFDAPKITMHYDEIINTYYGGVDKYAGQFSRAEFEELFAVITKINTDRRLGQLSDGGISAQRISKGYDGYYELMSTEYNYGPTYAGGKIVVVRHRPDGKWELVRVSRWVS